MEEVASGIDQSAFRYETDDLCSCHADSTRSGGTAHFIKCYMQRSGGDVCYVHGDLGYAIFVDEPSDGLCAFQCSREHDDISVGVFHRFSVGLATLAFGASFLADIECYCVGTSCGSGVEVEVDRDEEVACAYGCRSCPGYGFGEGLPAEVGGVVVGVYALRKGFVFTAAANGKVLAFGGESGCFVGVDRDGKLGCDSLPELTGKFSALFKRYVADGDQRKYVGGSHAWVCAMVARHVD